MIGPDDEACPYCATSDGIQQTSDTGRTQAWACDRCNTEWAISVIRPDSRAATLLNDLGAATEEIRRLRWKLTQLIALANDAATLPDQELRDRLLALATRATLAQCPQR
jgi:ribosomal protein L37AE/L43A